MGRSRDHYRGPLVDRPEQEALQAAMVAVAGERGLALEWPTCELAVLASLGAAVAARLAPAVAQCRDEGESWAEIGDLLGVTKQSARARFSTPAAAASRLTGDR